MEGNIKQVMISKEQIEQKIVELGNAITADYANRSLVAVCVLRGACVFFADLIRKIDLPLSIDFVEISSYGNSTCSSGELVMQKELSSDITDKDVLIVEDILDTGRTLNLLKQKFSKKAASVKICALLDKPYARVNDIKADYFGFVVANEFVVGYGLDYAQKYRNLKEICILDPKAYQK